MPKIDYSIVPINSAIDDLALQDFSCGSHEEELKINKFITSESKELDSTGVSKSFLYYRGEELVGFFSLCTSETNVTKDFKTRKFKMINRSLQFYPSVELTYFAIIEGEQNKNLGTAMMQSVIEMLYYNVYLYVGFIMITVTSRETTKDFYEKLGFIYHRTKSGNDNLMALTITEIELILGLK